MILTFEKPVVMGILNVTPDSFSDGGQYLDVDEAVARAVGMVSEGASIIDVGGESTGPGSVEVSVEEELSRVIPVVEALGGGILASVDTWKSEVARAAIRSGAVMVNDVTALRGDGNMAGVVAESGVYVVLMYSKDNSPRTTRDEREYEDVVMTVKDFLSERIEFSRSMGIMHDKIIIDPGMGAFVSGRSEYSWEILERLEEFKELGCPILVGASRKSFLGGKLEDRLGASLEAAEVAIKNGASIVRVHDVKETVKKI